MATNIAIYTSTQNIDLSTTFGSYMNIIGISAYNDGSGANTALGILRWTAGPGRHSKFVKSSSANGNIPSYTMFYHPLPVFVSALTLTLAVTITGAGQVAILYTNSSEMGPDLLLES